MFHYLPTRNFVKIEVTDENYDSLIKTILYAKDDHRQVWFLECDKEYPQKTQKNFFRFVQKLKYQK